MIMKCRDCNRKMSLTELTTYPVAYFLKLVAPALIPRVIAAIAHALLPGTKGVIDESMVGFANNFLISCPKCKKTECWDPVAELEAEGSRTKNLHNSQTEH